MGIAWGRKARLYISDESFANDDLTLVARTKDIKSLDEADDLVAEARDLTHKVHGQGSKDAGVEFERWIEEGEDGDDVALLYAAYQAGTDLYVLVTRDAKEVACGNGLRFVAQVLGFPEDYQLGEAANVVLQLKPSDPDQSPERTATPYADASLFLLSDGSPFQLSDGSQFVIS